MNTVSQLSPVSASQKPAPAPQPGLSPHWYPYLSLTWITVLRVCSTGRGGPSPSTGSSSNRNFIWSHLHGRVLLVCGGGQSGLRSPYHFRVVTRSPNNSSYQHACDKLYIVCSGAIKLATKFLVYLRKSLFGIWQIRVVLGHKVFLSFFSRCAELLQAVKVQCNEQ